MSSEKVRCPVTLTPRRLWHVLLVIWSAAHCHELDQHFIISPCWGRTNQSLAAPLAQLKHHYDAPLDTGNMSSWTLNRLSHTDAKEHTFFNGTLSPWERGFLGQMKVSRARMCSLSHMYFTGRHIYKVLMSLLLLSCSSQNQQLNIYIYIFKSNQISFLF